MIKPILTIPGIWFGQNLTDNKEGWFPSSHIKEIPGKHFYSKMMKKQGRLEKIQQTLQK